MDENLTQKPFRIPATAAVVLVLISVIFMVYAQTARFPFVIYDDQMYVTENAHVLGGFTWDNVRWAITTGHFNNWHPLTWLSHMADYRMFGMNAAPMHIENVLLHAVNTLLLFVILRRLAQKGSMCGICACGFAAALFAIHPLHVESVAWISERKDVLSTLWGFLAILMYLRYVDKPSIARYLPIVIFQAFALMSKSMLVTLPCILLLLDYWPLERLHRPMLKGAILDKIPLFALSIATGVIALFLRTAQTATTGGRLAHTAYSYAIYLLKTLWPANLSVFYPYTGDNIPTWQTALCMLVLLAITAAAFLSRKRAPYIWWGWLWYAITLAPAASFIQVGGHGIADRYTYIPLVGIFVALAWAGADAAERLGKRGKMVAGGAAATALMTLVLVCTVQVGYWRDSITLLTHAIAVTKDNKVAHYNLGSAYLEAGDNKNAAKEYEEVLKIEPDNLIAITNMGVAYAGMGKRDEAERIYYVALTLKPDDVSTLVNLAAALTDEGNLDQAIMHLTDAIAYEPENVTAHFNMAFTLMKKGDREAACRELSIVLQLQPNHPRAAKLHQDYCILKKESTAPPDTGGPAWQK